MGRFRLVIETMRPRQWLKNGFVLGGLLFSGRGIERQAILLAGTTFIAFSLLSGAMYLVNDARDAETDRLSPRTARRPIARGDLSIRAAASAAVAISVIALGLAALVNWETLAVLAGFAALQVAYSLVLKRLFLIDVMAIAAGFVLRALAGIVAIRGVMSPWLLLATGLLALFLGLTKRRTELVVLAENRQIHRSVLGEYSVPLVDELIAVVTPTTLVVYALYGVLGAHSQIMLVTLPFVLYGIFRVLSLLHHSPAAMEDPSVIAWRDKPLLVCIVCWAICAGAISVLTV